MGISTVHRNLNSVGKATFVTHFHLLTDANLSRQEKVVRLEKVLEHKDGCGRRVSHAASIVKAGGVVEALTLVANATRVTQQTKTQASELLKQYMAN